MHITVCAPVVPATAVEAVEHIDNARSNNSSHAHRTCCSGLTHAAVLSTLNAQWIILHVCFAHTRTAVAICTAQTATPDAAGCQHARNSCIDTLHTFECNHHIPTGPCHFTTPPPPRHTMQRCAQQQQQHRMHARGRDNGTKERIQLPGRANQSSTPRSLSFKYRLPAQATHIRSSHSSMS